MFTGVAKKYITPNLNLLNLDQEYRILDPKELRELTEGLITNAPLVEEAPPRADESR